MEMGEQKVESPAIITDQKTHEPFPAREFFCPSSFLIWRSLVREQIIAYPYSRKENEMNQSYLCIDLKSYYASVECVDRGLDPFTANLVVADQTRG